MDVRQGHLATITSGGRHDYRHGSNRAHRQEHHCSTASSAAIAVQAAQLAVAPEPAQPSFHGSSSGLALAW